jgi:hypothetical protein
MDEAMLRCKTLDHGVLDFIIVSWTDMDHEWLDVFVDLFHGLLILLVCVNVLEVWLLL